MLKFKMPSFVVCLLVSIVSFNMSSSLSKLTYIDNPVLHSWRLIGGLANAKRTRRSYTRLITPLSSKTLVGWKVELVTLGFDFDGLCFLVPGGVSLVFAQILVA
jgi:hypothetical protein